ncbi:hypothetical protein [Nonomuraea glycinis]|uniref:hypothetical protein n=1 Tax=Nonomuraea glycinis TaxID=2047744 RepID=UPI0033A9AABF
MPSRTGWGRARGLATDLAVARARAEAAEAAKTTAETSAGQGRADLAARQQAQAAETRADELLQALRAGPPQT